MNIYIGNLHCNTSEAEVTRLFEKFGAVYSVKIVMDKDSGQSQGFGFVEMDDQAAAQNAMQSLNNINYMNQYLEVSEAMSDNSRWHKR